MDRRAYVIAGAATIVLTAASLSAVAAAQPGTFHRSGPVAMRGPGWSASCTVPNLAGAAVNVVLADMGGPGMMAGRGMVGGPAMMAGRMVLHASPWSVPAGTVSFRVANHGARTHEFVVLPLAPGASAGARVVGADNRVDEAGSLGEASNDCGAGAGEGIRSGSAGWVTVSLKPGRYELVCNLPGHYAAGMYAELDAA